MLSRGSSIHPLVFERLAERTTGRDKPISSQARLAQLKAITSGGLHAPDDLGRIRIPVFVANGDKDLMVASEHSRDMAARLPDSRLRIYPDSGHGGIFQYHEAFVKKALEFLARMDLDTTRASEGETAGATATPASR